MSKDDEPLGRTADIIKREACDQGHGWGVACEEHIGLAGCYHFGAVDLVAPMQVTRSNNLNDHARAYLAEWAKESVAMSRDRQVAQTSWHGRAGNVAGTTPQRRRVAAFKHRHRKTNARQLQPAKQHTRGRQARRGPLHFYFIGLLLCCVRLNRRSYVPESHSLGPAATRNLQKVLPRKQICEPLLNCVGLNAYSLREAAPGKVCSGHEGEQAGQLDEWHVAGCMGKGCKHGTRPGRWAWHRGGLSRGNLGGRGGRSRLLVPVQP